MSETLDTVVSMRRRYETSCAGRLSHTFETGPVNVEVAVAAARPPQREGDAPDGQGGLRHGWPISVASFR